AFVGSRFSSGVRRRILVHALEPRLNVANQEAPENNQPRTRRGIMFRRVLRSVALLALLPLPALALNPGNPDPDPNPGTPTACSGTSLRAGQSTRTITVNGQRREYILWVPS